MQMTASSLLDTTDLLFEIDLNSKNKISCIHLCSWISDINFSKFHQKAQIIMTQILAQLHNWKFQMKFPFLATSFVNFISLLADWYAHNAKDDILDEVEKCLRQSRKV